MVVKYSYHGAHETGQFDTLERTFHQSVKPMSPVVVGLCLGKGKHEEDGLSCFCTNGCGFGFNVQMEPELQEGRT